ncbi:hypothetical protein DFQ04_3495 [Algoriphagus boseongensis]|uniref:Uncharacterized protein n=1 Tax=Algoriphagus boseongensis TaxID=1442587 RepID=A0A4R6T2A2_9BACT|nr:hypothetical protein [Algoriphagus boseongensis]TDQ13771.1 hypothetical protein DFQ04_3495 [Algoriphagus boseongensis]
MKAIELIFLGTTILSGIFILLGLIKPVLVLWFLDRFNRLKVLKIYGLVFFGSLILWWLTTLFA